MSRTAWLIVLLTGLLAFISLLLCAQWFYENNPATKTEATIIIPPHASFYKIVEILTNQTDLSHPLFFYGAERILGNHRSYPSGEFHLTKELTFSDLSHVLRKNKPVQHVFQVIEGVTTKTVIADLQKSDFLTGDITMIPLEGSLFPETYHVIRGTSRDEMVRRMQTMTDKTLKEIWSKRDPTVPLKSPLDALILASIVEKESAGNDDRRHVASVFLNRLRAGMPLQSDPTIIYALSDGTGRFSRPLQRRDWGHDSPYNTYLYDGLPPTPICLPSLESLKAVLNPLTTNYYFFVADGKGGHVFAKTLKEHNNNVRAFYRIKKETEK